MNSLINFDYGERPVRVIMDEAGEPWWVAADVCQILGLKDANMSTKALDDDERLLQTLLGAGQERQVITISESGLYTLIIRSNKKEARTFRKWITSEVLPAIRRTGRYELPDLEAPITDGQATITVARLSEAAQGIKAAMIMARAFGFRDNEARRLANSLVKRITGIDAMDLLGVPADMEEVEEDPLFSDFVFERCVTDPGARIGATELYSAFTKWCVLKGISTPSVKAMGHMAGERFRRTKINGLSFYCGIKLKTEG